MISRRAVVGTGLTLPFLAAPGRAQSKPGHLRFGLSAWPPNLQPWVTTGVSAGTVKTLIHRSLLSLSPALAWAYEDREYGQISWHRGRGFYRDRRKNRHLMQTQYSNKWT